MAFTPAQERQINDFLSRQRPNGNACPLCGVNNWWLEGPIYADVTGGRGGSIPMATMICSNCAHMEFMSLGVMGFR